MRKCSFLNLLGLLPLVTLVGVSQISVAQVIPDTTLSTEVLTFGGINFLIQDGTRAEGNLFHSFEEFSIPTGGIAFFNQSPDVRNIISRVTGDNFSSLDGELRANGTANLFLINPAGIFFGPNASLNIGGSFIATTAQQLSFLDGAVLTAGDNSTAPQLTISRPLGLRFTQNSGEIGAFDFSGSLLSSSSSAETDRSSRPLGLAVASGESLSLLGNRVLLSGANLTASGGRIDIGSLSNGDVTLSPLDSKFTFNYDDVTDFSNIMLNRSASIDVAGSGGGDVDIQGATVLLEEGSAILSDTLGADQGGTIAIRATDLVGIGGTLPLFRAGIYADVGSNAAGRGSDLLIETNRLQIIDGGLISVSTFGSGRAGNTIVKAETVEVETFSLFPGNRIPAAIVSQSVGGSGRGGDILLEADRLTVAGGGQVGTGAFGMGQSGNLTVDANIVEVTGTDPSRSVFSSLSTQADSESIGGAAGLLSINADQILVSDLALISAALAEGGQGQGGTIELDTGSLTILDGAQVTTATLGQGSAGDIRIRADTIDIQGNGVLGNRLVRSGISSAVEALGTGQGGDISIIADRLSVRDLGFIVSRTSGRGDAGNINVDASDITLTDIAAFEASVEPDAIGQGGEINIDATTINLLNGSRLTSSTAGQGDSGNIRIQAETLNIQGARLSETMQPFSSGITSATRPGAIGNGADIDINVDTFLLTDGGIIDNITENQGNAGNTNISAQEVLIEGTSPLNQSRTSILSVTASDGNGGSVNVDTNRLTIVEGGQINVSSISTSTGRSGNINVVTQDIRLVNNGRLSAETGPGQQGNINLQVDGLLFLNKVSQITTDAEEDSAGGNIVIDAGIILLNQESEIIARAVEGQGGNIQLTTGQLLLSTDSSIDASSQFGVDGTVVLDSLTDNSANPVELSDAPIMSDQIIADSCLVTNSNSTSQFIISGAGGLSATPNDPSQSIFETYSIPLPQSAAPDRSQLNTPQPQPAIVEAQGAYRSADGHVVLAARSCR